MMQAPVLTGRASRFRIRSLYMPQIIEHIDAIARKKKRDVLFVTFHKWERDDDGIRMLDAPDDWRTYPPRQRVIEWLDSHDIPWQPCGHFANVRLMMSYAGQIYIDVPYDTSLPAYQLIERFLENPDGTMAIAGAVFCYTTLEEAQKNAEHDEPGFWEAWAEKF
jgi:hypothetical protein